MDMTQLLGPYGLVVGLIITVIHLYRENTALRKDAMDLLRKYQDRDEEERRLRVSEERRRDEERWRGGVQR